MELSDAKNITEGDTVTEPVKMVETQCKGLSNPALVLGNSDMIMPF